MYHHILHLFRRDLRLVDNTALEEARTQAIKISLGFIFDPAQIKPHQYQSKPALHVLCKSLAELAEQTSLAGGVLNIWHGDPIKILEAVLEHEPIDAVSINADYTPFSTARDQKIATLCEKRGIPLLISHDALLNPPGSVRTQQDKMYAMFTPFYRAADKIPVSKPTPEKALPLAKQLLYHAHKNIPEEIRAASTPTVAHPVVGGRRAGLKVLATFQHQTGYATRRDLPADTTGTSHLSPYLKCGALSVREVYWHIKNTHKGAGEPFLRSLYWRDFFTHVAADTPHVFGHPYNPAYQHLTWHNNPSWFARWCEGTTGFPLVDAGIRELLATGTMHNRVRMVAASLLIKTLHIDWRLGERFFAQHLADYDPAVNNGNWQWVASTGCDAQPYFRIFNPWLQQKKFDPEAVYIKQWLPELAHLTPKAIHALARSTVRGYPAPLVDHAVESKKTLARYRALRKK